MLGLAKIYARMSPDLKALLVEQLQKDERIKVGMCGDGANDCNALKTADVGISLSEAEASIAAPFTSQVADITCVVRVLREGRAALVTSISTFMYMEIYSMIQFTSVTMLYFIGSNLGDFQYLLIDLFILTPLAFFMGLPHAYPRLTHHVPSDCLISFPVLFSILGHVAIVITTQVTTQLF